MSASAAGISPKDGSIQSTFFQTIRPFVVGGSSGMTAIAIVQPLDMIKVRLQLYGEGSHGGSKPSAIGVARKMIAEEGFISLYEGLSAGLLRQAVYGTTRLGLFFKFEDTLKKRASDKNTTYGFTQRAMAGLTAGGIAALIGNPVEVALIRMQSDGLKPKAQQMNYRSVFHALSSVAGNEGIRSLWKGAYPTIARAMATNFGQLAFFSETKSRMANYTKSEMTQTVTASFGAGFFASFFSLTFVFVNTRLQRQGKGDAIKYTGLADCFVKVAKEEGLLRFYRGFTTYFMRIGPYT